MPLISSVLVADFLAMARKVLYNSFANLENSVLPMKHRSRLPEQDDFLRPRLVDLIDPRHELVKLTSLITGKYSTGNGRGSALRRWGVQPPSRVLWRTQLVSPPRLSVVGPGRGRPMGREPLLPAPHG